MATDKEIRAVLERFEINPYGPGMSMGDEDRIRTLAAALADSERERDDYNRRYETSHATRLHAEAALERVERERDEAESDMAAANITIRRLSAKLAVVVDAANDLDRETIVTEDGQREVVDQAAVIRLEDAIADLPTAARKLLDEVEASDKLIQRQGKLLTGVVNAINGDPPPDTLWSHHDAPKLAQALRDEVEALRADRERLDFISEHCGGDGVLEWRFGTSGKVRICVGNDYQDLRAAIDAARGSKT